MSNAVSFVRGLVNRVEEKVDDFDLATGDVLEFAAQALLVVKAGLAEADKALAKFDTEPERAVTTEDKLNALIKAADRRFGEKHSWRSEAHNRYPDEVSNHYDDLMNGRNGWTEAHRAGM